VAEDGGERHFSHLFKKASFEQKHGYRKFLIEEKGMQPGQRDKVASLSLKNLRSKLMPF